MMKLELGRIPEPRLEFGEGEEQMPKVGLATCGPYSLQLGPAHPQTIKVGLIGPGPEVDAAHRFLERAEKDIPSGKENRALFPDFPGFEKVFRSELVHDPVLDLRLDGDRLEKALAQKPARAFKDVLRLWLDGIRQLSERDVRPDVIGCCLPKAVVDACHHLEVSPASAAERKLRRAEEKRRRQGQYSLFDLGPEAERIEDVALPSPEDLLRRDFRRVLKAGAMEARVPIQLLTPKTFEEGYRGQEDPATRTWNLSVGTFYKGGGIPWRIKPQLEHTCFVGISFHHLRTKATHVVYASLAQAFSTEGDGFALRGDAMPWDEHDREVHLSKEQIFELLTRVLDAYRDRAGRDPLRVVIHKSSSFSAGELDGARRALDPVPSHEFIVMRSGDFRVVRQGKYPPDRGSICQVGDSSFLFTGGYVPSLGTYPGPHIPVPLQLVGLQGDPESNAEEIMGLTKMNWNSAAATHAFPITLRFAKQVGLIMAEVRPDRTPHPAYRFYM